jgi:DNA-binding response OmpR family regulator
MKRSVLIVDDDRAIVAALADLLRDEGYQVRTAFDGLSALAESELEPPDLVLSDIAMPRLNGMALAQRLRERGVPVVLLSAAVSDPRLADVPFIAKPFDLDHVLGLVERMVGAPSPE